MKTAAELRALAAQCRQKAEAASQAAHHASDYAPGSYITGGSGRTRAQNRATERALERTITQAGRAVRLRKLAEKYDAEAAWLENAPRRQTQAARQAVVERDINAWKRSLLQPGAQVELLCNGHLLTVKRVNAHSVTTAQGVRWSYPEIMPLTPEGERRTTAAAVREFNAWRAAQPDKED